MRTIIGLVAVLGFVGGLVLGLGSHTVRAQSPTPTPANDNFADATVIAAIPFSDGPHSTANATTEPGEPVPCGSIGATVWYSFTANENAVITADTFGSDYDTALAVYTGTPYGR